MKLSLGRGRLLPLAILVVAVFTASLLVLVGLGILVIPTAPKPTLRVLGGDIWIAQGSTSHGGGWFGPSYLNITTPADGYPLNVTVGGSFGVSVTLDNFDTVSHTVYSASVNSPFRITGTFPTLPFPVSAGTDSGVFRFTVAVPDSAGAALWLNLTVNALTP